MSKYNNNKKFIPYLLKKGVLNIGKPDLKINTNINKFNDEIYYKARIENFYIEEIYVIYKKNYS